MSFNDPKSEWSIFYNTINRLGPRLLQGLHPELKEWVAIQAADSDAFWSEWLHGDFRLWEEGDRIKAVQKAFDDWVDKVKDHLYGILGPDTLLPLKQYGISRRKRKMLIASIHDVNLKLNEEHIKTFVDSVTLEYASTTSLPSLILQGIITPYDKTDEGKLIRTIAIPWSMIVNHLKRDWTLAYQISSDKWEELVAAAFDRAGYDEVTLTPRSGDYGRDVIAVKKGMCSIRIIGSVKAYKPGHLVKHDDVRALAGVLLGDHQASKGIITTTSSFAPNIIQDPFLKLLMPYRLELMDGKSLQKWLEELALD